jgi:hypothetical protein
MDIEIFEEEGSQSEYDDSEDEGENNLLFCQKCHRAFTSWWHPEDYSKSVILCPNCKKVVDNICGEDVGGEG